MSTFRKNSFATPLARNVYLRSTQDVKTISYTVAKSSITETTIDGHPGQKVLQPGTVMAKITSGTDSGKIGPYDNSGTLTDGRQTAANIVGINNTFLPWQLIERDVAVAVVYEASVTQANCIVYITDGTVSGPLDDTTAAAMVAKKNIDIRCAA